MFFFSLYVYIEISKRAKFTLGTQLLWWKRNTESSEIKKNYREGRYTIKINEPRVCACC